MKGGGQTLPDFSDSGGIDKTFQLVFFAFKY